MILLSLLFILKDVSFLFQGGGKIVGEDFLN